MGTKERLSYLSQVEATSWSSPPATSSKARVHFLGALGNYCLRFGEPWSPQFWGVVLFIAGSVAYTVAAFLNAMNRKEWEWSWADRMLSLVTSFYFAGSLLCCLGSVAFLPDLGCGEEMIEM